jgi:diguanylate cyclase (GGDEF)-like protein
LKLVNIRTKKREAIGYILGFIFIIAIIQVALSNMTYHEHINSKIAGDIERVKDLVKISFRDSEREYQHISSAFIEQHKVGEYISNRDINEIDAVIKSLSKILKKADSSFSTATIFDAEGGFLAGNGNELDGNKEALLNRTLNSSDETDKFQVIGNRYQNISRIYFDGQLIGFLEVSFLLTDKLALLKNQFGKLYQNLSNIDFAGLLIRRELIETQLKDILNYRESGDFVVLGSSTLLTNILTTQSTEQFRLQYFQNIEVQDGKRSLIVFQDQLFKSGTDIDASIIYILDKSSIVTDYIMYNMKLLALMLLLMLVVYVLIELSWRYFISEMEESISEFDKVVTENRDIETLFESGKVAVAKVSNSEDLPIEFISNSIKDITGFSKGDKESFREFFVHSTEFIELQNMISNGDADKHNIFLENVSLRTRDGGHKKVDIKVIIGSYEDSERAIFLSIQDNSICNLFSYKLELMRDRLKFLLSSIEHNFWEFDIQKRQLYTSLDKSVFDRVQEDIHQTILKQTYGDIKFSEFTITYNDKDKFYEHTIKEALEESSFSDFKFTIEKPYQRVEKGESATKIEVVGKEIIQGSETIRILGVNQEVKPATTVEDGNIKIDSLKSLMSRDEIEKTLEREVERSRRYRNPLSLIFFQIDDFVGMEELEGVEDAQEIMSQLISQFDKLKRATDIVGRWSRTEFIFIAFETDIDSVKIFAEKLRKLAESSVFKNSVKLSCSFGVDEFNLRYDKNLFIQKAHKGLVLAKQSGGNRVVQYVESE